MGEKNIKINDGAIIRHNQIQRLIMISRRHCLNLILSNRHIRPTYLIGTH